MTGLFASSALTTMIMLIAAFLFWLFFDTNYVISYCLQLEADKLVLFIALHFAVSLSWRSSCDVL